MKFEIEDGGTHTHNALALRTALDSLCQQRDTTLTQVMLRSAEDRRGLVITVTSAGFVQMTEEQIFERDTRIAATLAPCVKDALNAAWARNIEARVGDLRVMLEHVVSECGDGSPEVAAMRAYIEKAASLIEEIET